MTTALGDATSIYPEFVAGVDVNPVGVAGASVGKNRDDICGVDKCAEELSDKGLHRANLLAGWFARQGVVRRLDAVYASHKYRTYQTVMPTATLADLEVMQLPADGTELNPEGTTASECLTIEAINATPAGDTILVAGHSGTLYDIMGDGNLEYDGMGNVIGGCAGLGLLTDDDASSDRFPKDAKGKVRDFGDIWKVVIRNGKARFVYRVNLETTKLQIVDWAR